MVGKKLLIVLLWVTASSFALPEKFSEEHSARHSKHDCFKDIQKNNPNAVYKIATGVKGKRFLQEIDTAKTEQRESAARAFLLSLAIGFSNSVRFGDNTKNHILGYLFAGGSNAFIGAVGFKDRNYWAQFLGISIGYATGALLPTIVGSANDAKRSY